MRRGFTIIELLVTAGIVIIISALIFANFPQFSRQLQLSRTARAIALSFRQAESSAMAVREFSSGSGVFPAYGLHFETSEAKSYVFFADIDEDYKSPLPGVSFYDAPGEKIDVFNINNLPEIKKICGGAASSPPGDCSINWLDVVYVRPNPDIHIFTDNGPFGDVAIVIDLPNGLEKKVIIWESGLLYIDD